MAVTPSRSLLLPGGVRIELIGLTMAELMKLILEINRAMLSFSSGQRYFLYRGAADMRKGFNRLSGLVHQDIKHDLLSGNVFDFTMEPFTQVSCNKRRDQVKISV